MSAPYADTARQYLDLGYAPLPLPTGSKYPPPEGFTGSGASFPDAVQVDAWIAGRGDGNVALRLPGDVVGLDVDHYDKAGADKRGLDQLAHLESELGALPPTIMSTSRTNGSGLRLFRVPMGTRLRAFGSSIDTIRTDHRYVVAPPSIHPDTGATYRWIDSHSGEVLQDAWHVEDLPPLPDTWVEHFRAESTGPGTPKASAGRVVEFARQHTEALDPQRLLDLLHRCDRLAADVECRHDAMQKVLCESMREVAAGAYSFTEARAALHRWWQDAFAAGDRVPGPTEFDDMVAWAIGQTDDEADRIAAMRATMVRRATVADPERYIDRKDGLRARVLVADILAAVAIRTGMGEMLWRYHGGVWLPDGRQEVDRRCRDLLGDRFRENYANTAQRWLRADEPTICDTEPTDVLNFRNGLLDWRSGTLRDHTPAVPSTYQIPHDWNPDATCPTVDAWLAEVFPADALEFAWEVIGYLLYPANPYHRAILMLGAGRNGKSTFLGLMRHLIGHAHYSTVTLQQLGEDRFAAAALYRKVANIAGDLDARAIRQTDLFKMATGGDAIGAQRKYGQPFTFTNHATFLFAANELPGSADLTDGFFARWIIVPFTGYFPEAVADRTLPARLHAEAEGVIAKAVPALRRLLERGGFDLPTSVMAATTDYRAKADPVVQFADERLDVAPGARVRRPALYDAYKAWCEDCGHHPLARRRFVDRIRSIRPNTYEQRSHGVDYVVGIELTDRAGAGASGEAGAGFLSPPLAYGGKGDEPSPSSPADEEVSF